VKRERVTESAFGRKLGRERCEEQRESVCERVREGVRERERERENVCVCMRQREREREKERERHTERQRDRARERERERSHELRSPMQSYCFPRAELLHSASILLSC